MTRRQYKGNTSPTTLVSTISNSTATISVTDGSTFPDGSIGPFTVVIDRGLSGEEKILVSTRTANTFNGCTRGFDGTAGTTHNGGATVEHCLTATDLDEANLHVNSTTNVHGVTGTIVDTTSTQTLTNKTLGTGTVLPATVVDTTSVQTLTNKTLGSGTVFPATVVDTTSVQTIGGPKTLTSPTVNTPTISNGTATGTTLSGGTISGTTTVSGTLSGGTYTPTSVNGTTMQRGGTDLSSRFLTVNAQVGTTYTLVLSDGSDTIVTLNNAGAITVTVPTNASVAFPIGTIIDFAQLGAGQVTFSPAAGVTVNAANSATKITSQYGTCALVKYATDTWLLMGGVS